MQSIEGLKSQSQRPPNSPTAKIEPSFEKFILELRNKQIRALMQHRILDPVSMVYGEAIPLYLIRSFIHQHSHHNKNIGDLYRGNKGIYFLAVVCLWEVFE